MKILQSNIETRDINLLIGDYGFSLPDDEVFQIEQLDGALLTLNINELNDYKWAEFYDIEDDETMLQIIKGLRLLGIVESWQLKVFDEICLADPFDKVPEKIPPVRTIEELQHDFTSTASFLKHSERDNNPLTIALKKLNPPDRKRVSEQKSKTRNLLTTANYGKFQNRVAKRLMDEFQEKYGNKVFHCEPRQLAYFIYNGNSFDGCKW
jgi:hypothetical protein